MGYDQCTRKTAGFSFVLLFHLQETLKNKVEDFVYSTAADRREAQHLEEKCAELERVVTSADVVGTFHWESQPYSKIYFPLALGSNSLGWSSTPPDNTPPTTAARQW